MADCDCVDSEFSPLQAGLPGAAGRRGQKGDPGNPGANGKNAYSSTTALFLVPASGATVDITVADTGWMAVGQAVFIENAGYFTVASVLSPTSVRVRNTGLVGNGAVGATIASGSKVTAGGYAFVDTSSFSSLETRVSALESASSPGNKTYYQTSAPSGALVIGDLWFDIDDGYKLYRWDGTTWVDTTRDIAAGDFGSGLRAVKYVTSLPSSGNTIGDLAFLSTDKKLYRYTGSAWTAAIAGSDITGTIDGSQLAANSIVAGSFQFGLAIGDKLSASDAIIRNSAQIADATILSAKIIGLDAGKIDVGDLKVGVRMNVVNRLYTSGGARDFRSMDFANASGNSFVFGSGTSFSFTSIPGAKLVGPNVSLPSGGATFCPDETGVVRVEVAGTLIGYTGNITVYYRKNNTGPYIAIAAVNSSDGGNARVRALVGPGLMTGMTVNDSLEFFVAPCDANGDNPSPVTCRYELSVTAFNW
jgi:hypothetical protein